MTIPSTWPVSDKFIRLQFAFSLTNMGSRSRIWWITSDDTRTLNLIITSQDGPFKFNVPWWWSLNYTSYPSLVTSLSHLTMNNDFVVMSGWNRNQHALFFFLDLLFCRFSPICKINGPCFMLSACYKTVQGVLIKSQILTHKCGLPTQSAAMLAKFADKCWNFALEVKHIINIQNIFASTTFP